MAVEKMRVRRRHPEVDGRYRLLYERHWRRVRAYALRRTSCASAADDIVAEVFLVAWRRIGDIPSENELAWLLGVARRVLSNAARGDARRNRLIARMHEAAQAVPPDHLLPTSHTAGSPSSEAGEAINAALGRLRPADAEILQLVAWEELSHAEIAAVLACSTNAVAIRLHRARQRLEDEFAKVWTSPGDIASDAPEHRRAEEG